MWSCHMPLVMEWGFQRKGTMTQCCLMNYFGCEHWFQLLSWLSAYLFDMWSSLFSAIWGNTKNGQCSKNFLMMTPVTISLDLQQLFFLKHMVHHMHMNGLFPFELDIIAGKMTIRWPSKTLFFIPLSPLRVSSTESSTDSVHCYDTVNHMIGNNFLHAI